MTEMFNRYHKLAYVANELMTQFSMQDIYVIMRRINRIYPWQCYNDIHKIDELEMQYDCYERCWNKAKHVQYALEITHYQDVWPYME